MSTPITHSDRLPDIFLTFPVVTPFPNGLTSQGDSKQGPLVSLDSTGAYNLNETAPPFLLSAVCGDSKCCVVGTQAPPTNTRLHLGSHSCGAKWWSLALLLKPVKSEAAGEEEEEEAQAGVNHCADLREGLCKQNNVVFNKGMKRKALSWNISLKWSYYSKNRWNKILLFNGFLHLGWGLKDLQNLGYVSPCWKKTKVYMHLYIYIFFYFPLLFFRDLRCMPCIRPIHLASSTQRCFSSRWSLPGCVVPQGVSVDLLPETGEYVRPVHTRKKVKTDTGDKPTSSFGLGKRLV